MQSLFPTAAEVYGAVKLYLSTNPASGNQWKGKVGSSLAVPAAAGLSDLEVIQINGGRRLESILSCLVPTAAPNGNGYQGVMRVTSTDMLPPLPVQYPLAPFNPLNAASVGVPGGGLSENDVELSLNSVANLAFSLEQFAPASVAARLVNGLVYL
jgi:hypothetical protein